MCGFIKLHRQITEWEWYGDTNTFRLFLHLIITANWKDKQWQGITVKRGQLVTGRKSLSEQTGLSEMQIRTSLEKLKSTSELTIKATNRYSIIELRNYDLYQQNDQPVNKQITTTKEILPNGNIKNKRSNIARTKFIEPSIEELKVYFSERGHESEAEKFFDFYSSKGWMVGKNKMKDWKASVRNWCRDKKPEVSRNYGIF